MSLTEGNRALQLFTDRHDLTKLFAEFLNDELPREQILYFHGDGGNGKSLLLKFLQTKCCKRFKESCWQEIKGKSAQRVAEYVEKLAHDWEFKRVPAVVQDFEVKPRDDDQPKDAFYGLLMLRRKLANAATELKYSLRFPLYDFACVWYLHQKNKSAEEIKRLFPLSEIAALIAPLIDIVTKNQVGTVLKTLLDFFAKDLSNKFTLSWQERQLKEADVQAIYNMDVDTELFFELPRFFAQDLNAAMAQEQAPPRLVLFFDTHEAFWGKQRHLQGEEFFQPDEWLRYFLKELDLSSGVVVVVAGREIPRWHQAIKWEIEQSLVHSELVDHFAPEDARTYLQQEGIGIAEAQLQQSLIDYASVDAEKQQIHPLLLGLCADVVEKAKEQGVTLTAADFPVSRDLKQKTRELLDKLLKYVDIRIADAVYALSAARAFDEELYYQLGAARRFQATEADFEILTGFSFVWKADKGEGWLRIHDLIRRLDYQDERKNTKRQKAHEFLEQYYREQGNIAEAIYHANRLDWERGVNEWKEVFEKALQQSRYQLCRSLQEIRNELIIESDFQLGLVSQYEGDYFAKLAQYENAEQKYFESIGAYAQEISIKPDNAAALNNKGTVLQDLGDLQAKLAQYDAALESYKKAITIYEQALDIVPNYIAALTNQGIALTQLSQLQAQLTKYDESFENYAKALTTYDRALELKPDDIAALNNRGNMLQHLGNLQVVLSRYDSALVSYYGAIDSYEKVLCLRANYTQTIENKASALTNLGQLQTDIRDYDKALLSYTDALKTYNQALELTPDSIDILRNKSLTLQALGDLQVLRSQDTLALGSYREAIATCNQCLNLAPNDIYALNNMGSMLQSLGDLQLKLNNDDALKSYKNALDTYEQALNIAPDYINTLNNKVNLLQKLGDLQVQLNQSDAAFTTYNEAIETCKKALEIAPNYIPVINNKGNIRQSLGKLQADLDRFDEALENYRQAIVAYDDALELSPNYVTIINNRGIVLEIMGNLQVQQSQKQEAIESWQGALAAFNRSLTIASNNDYIQNRRDRLQEFLDNLANG